MQPAITPAYRFDIQTLMAKAGIRTVAQLHRLLLARGCDISHSQLTRIVDGIPKSVSVQMISLMCDLFDCTPGDLFTLS